MARRGSLAIASYASSQQGHVLGSAQICITHEGKTLIAAGDYKRKYDPTVIPFEVRSCDVFITEATFGLPVFTHQTLLMR